MLQEDAKQREWHKPACASSNVPAQRIQSRRVYSDGISPETLGILGIGSSKALQILLLPEMIMWALYWHLACQRWVAELIKHYI